MDTLDTGRLLTLLLGFTFMMLMLSWCVWKAILELAKINSDPKPKGRFKKELQWIAMLILFVFIIVGGGVLSEAAVTLCKGVVKLWSHW